ncbi:hypothetical protein [Elizabethkingia meningoseptica]|uniref:hypothetical protein n=1 Tax=Elizabethkingia meningoseptica TaxID=238 RepID=UPI0016273D91|nr:hypothetical protein [Elizabethkingia meningoseptica]
MEPKQDKIFQDLEVFDNPLLNEYCDTIYNSLNDNFGNTSGIIMGGSVARVLDGLTGYEPKDVDFIIKNQYVYRFLQANVRILFPEFSIIEDNMRIIIFTGIVAIELWKGGTIYATQEKLYKNKLSYIV